MTCIYALFDIDVFTKQNIHLNENIPKIKSSYTRSLTIDYKLINFIK